MLHITSPTYPDTFAQHLGVDIGKRCAYLDLRGADDLARMHTLARTTDVFTTTYRGSINRRFGLQAEALSARSERGIVCMTANAYGHTGPWADGPGFDQNGQVASGFAAKEGEPDKPRFSPVFVHAPGRVVAPVGADTRCAGARLPSGQNFVGKAWMS